MVEADDRRQERRERQEAERKAAGLPEPEFHWTPPAPRPPGTDYFGNPMRKVRKSRRTFTS